MSQLKIWVTIIWAKSPMYWKELPASGGNHIQIDFHESGFLEFQAEN